MGTQLGSFLAGVPLLGNVVFFGGVGTAAAGLIAAIIFGASQFQKRVSKIVAIGTGVLPVALLVFVVFVLFISDSAWRGNPM